MDLKFAKAWNTLTKDSWFGGKESVLEKATDRLSLQERKPESVIPASSKLSIPPLGPVRAAKFEATRNYTAEYVSPVRPFLSSPWGTFAGWTGSMSITFGLLFFGISGFTDPIFWAIAPTPAFAAAGVLGAMDLPKRFSYRKNISRAKQVKVTARQLRRFIQWSYNLKVVAVPDWAWNGYGRAKKPNFRNTAEAVLTEESYEAKFYAENADTHEIVKYAMKYDAGKRAFLLHHAASGKLVDVVRKPDSIVQVSAGSEVTQVKKALQSADGKTEKTPERKSGLPELVVDAESLAFLSKDLRLQVQHVADVYNAVRESPLTVEDSYVVERAGEDLREAVSLFRTITRLSGSDADEYVAKLLTKLAVEVEGVRARSLEAAMSAMQSRQLYVETR